jgi:hypothetical protein
MPASASNAGEKAANAKGDKVTQADLAANAPDSYTVVKGDTLWGIAGKFLKDPWKWPQIWQKNRDEIKDPHWIYPGDVIRLNRDGDLASLSLDSRGGAGGPSGGTAADAESNVVKVEPRMRVEALQEAIPSIPGAVIGPFLTQPLVIEGDGMENAPRIVATGEGRVVVGAGDSAYADRIGTEDGINWQIYRPGNALRDPETGELLGYEAKYLGDARVRRFGNPTTLDVLRAREEINRGDRLVAARELAYPSYMPRAPGKPIKGVIMSVEGGVSEVGQFQVVTINRGARDGIEVGHVLATLRRGPTVDRNGRVIDEVVPGGSWMSKLNWDSRPTPVVPDATPAAPARSGPSKTGVAATGNVRLPDERNGLLFVFRVFDKMSYGLIMRATRPIYVGDYVQTP